MINKIVGISATNRQKNSIDPFEFHSLQIIKEQITSFITYIFRGLRLIKIINQQNIFQSKQLQNFFQERFGIEEGKDSDYQALITHQIESILGLNFAEPGEKCEEFLNEISTQIAILCEKFNNGQQQEKAKIPISGNSFQKLRQIEMMKKRSNSEYQFANKQCFIQLVAGQSTLETERSAFQSEQLKEIEQKILTKLLRVMQSLKGLAARLYNNAPTYKSQVLTCRPVQCQQHSSFELTKPLKISEEIINVPKFNFQNFLDNQIFPNKQLTKVTNFKKLQSRINIQTIKNQLKRNVEQQAISEYLSKEKLSKQIFIQNYYRKYQQSIHQNKDCSRTQVNRTQVKNVEQQKKIENIKVQSKSVHIVEQDQPSNRTIKLKSSQLLTLLQQQKKEGYQERIIKAKRSKIFQAVAANNISIISNAGFKFGHQEYNCKDEKNNSALFYSAQNNYYEMCKFLLENGANPNLNCQQGKTATHLACEQRDPKLHSLFAKYGIRSYQSKGADFNMPDEQGQTPQEIYERDLSPSPLKMRHQELIQTSPKFNEFLIF